MKAGSLFNLKANFSETNRCAEPFFSVSQRADQLWIAVHGEFDEQRIMVHGIVGDAYEGMDARTLVQAIHDAHGKQIILDINTPGGLVYDAVSIYTALVEHEGGVRADITGAAESSGTIIASAADMIRIAQAGRYMIHRAWTLAVVLGNEEEFGEFAETVVPDIRQDLKTIDGQLAKILADRSGMEVDDVLQLMIGEEGKDGTMFTGSAAVEKGFVDELIPNKKKPTATNKTPFKRHAALTTLSRLKAA